MKNVNILLSPVLILVCVNCSRFEARNPASFVDSSEAGVQSLKCEPSTRGTSEYGVRRLTKSELIASLRSLFGAHVIANAQVAQSLAAIPEQVAKSNARFNNDIIDVAGLEAGAEAIADFVVNDPATLNQVLGCSTVNLAQCTDPLLKKLAYRAFRSPLSPETEQSIRSLVTSIGGIEGLREGIVRVLTSPFFHQHIEIGGNVEGGRIRLTPFEVASRLSFQLIGSIPDQALLDAAAQGKLSDVAAVRAQAVRLLALPEARENWRRLTKDWLGLKNVSDPLDMVAGEFGIPANGFGKESLEELLRFSVYQMFDKRADFTGLLTENVAIPFTDRLAKVYGVPKSDTPTRVESGHGGMILRPATLMIPRDASSPILRGLYIQEHILCTELPSPDPNQVNAQLDMTAHLTRDKYSTRHIAEQQTKPVTCMGCHSIINPIGFSLETFGPLGTPRKVESVFNTSGAIIATHPIDAAVADLRINPASTIPSSGASATVKALGASALAKRCFSKTLLMNTRYRAVKATDNCLINEMDNALKSGLSIMEVFIRNAANEEIFFKASTGN